jgi:hypothetical protein
MLNYLWVSITASSENVAGGESTEVRAPPNLFLAENVYTKAKANRKKENFVFPQ